MRVIVALNKMEPIVPENADGLQNLIRSNDSTIQRITNLLNGLGIKEPELRGPSRPSRSKGFDLSDQNFNGQGQALTGLTRRSAELIRDLQSHDPQKIRISTVRGATHIETILKEYESGYGSRSDKSFNRFLAFGSTGSIALLLGVTTSPLLLFNWLGSLGYLDVLTPLGAIALGISAYHGTKPLRHSDPGLNFRHDLIRDKLKHVDRSKNDWVYFAKDIRLKNGIRVQYDQIFQVEMGETGLEPVLTIIQRTSKALAYDEEAKPKAEEPSNQFRVWKFGRGNQLVSFRNAFYLFTPNRFRKKADNEFDIRKLDSLSDLRFSELGMAGFIKALGLGANVFKPRTTWTGDIRTLAPDGKDFIDSLIAGYAVGISPSEYGTPTQSQGLKSKTPEPLRGVRRLAKIAALGLIGSQLILPSPLSFLRVPSHAASQTLFKPDNTISPLAWVMNSPLELGWRNLERNPFYPRLVDEYADSATWRNRDALGLSYDDIEKTFRRPHYSLLWHVWKSQKNLEAWVNDTAKRDISEFEYRLVVPSGKGDGLDQWLHIDTPEKALWILRQGEVMKNPDWFKLANSYKKRFPDLDLNKHFADRPDLLETLSQTK